MRYFFDYYPAQQFDYFFLSHQWLILFLSGLLIWLLLYSSNRNYLLIEKRTIALQLFFILLLNCWYVVSRYQWLKESLPLYHCRIFMWGLVICHYIHRHDWKMFFAIGGVLGSVVAFLIPATDPFNFPHITILSFIFGHLLLSINALLTLKLHYRRLQAKEILFSLTLISIVMVIVNRSLQANYGFMSHPPKNLLWLIDTYIPSNLYPIFLTALLAGFMCIANYIIGIIKDKRCHVKNISD